MAGDVITTGTRAADAARVDAPRETDPATDAEQAEAGAAGVPDPGMAADMHAVSGTSTSLVDPQIMAALMRLPARQRQVVALRLILDMDPARTAAVLGIAPGTVMAHLGRAMAALRLDLQPELSELQGENRP